MTTQHFARLIAGQRTALDTAMGRAYPGAQTMTTSMHTTPAARAVGLPTLGETGMKFNSSRWTQGGAEEGLSVFDMRGAMEALEKGPEQSSTRRAHPAQLAHAARIARAQQVGMTLYGFKVFPDLTPGRAFMWGTILAVYAVGVTSYAVARSVGVTSVGDIREKMQAAFAPYKDALQAHASSARSGLTLRERPAVFDQLESVGASIGRTLGKPEALLDREALDAKAHH